MVNRMEVKTEMELTAKEIEVLLLALQLLQDKKLCSRATAIRLRHKLLAEMDQLGAI